MVSRFPLKVREKTGTDDGQHVFHTIKTALSSSFMVMVMDPSGNVIEVNDKFVQLFQYTSTELRKLWFLNSGYHADSFWQELLTTLGQGEQWIGDLCLRTKHGEFIWVNATIIPFEQSTGPLANYLIVLQNVSDRKAMEKWRHLACHHDLTNLPNRRMFHLSCASYLERARRQRSKLAVFYVDVNHFKKINDAHGHSVGDLLLQEVAHRFQHHPSTMNRVFHFGGDEFVILIEFDDDLLDFSEAIQTIFARPFRVGEHCLDMSVSLGGSIFPDHSADIAELLKFADSAMFAAKREGGTCIRMYSKPMKGLREP